MEHTVYRGVSPATTAIPNCYHDNSMNSVLIFSDFKLFIQTIHFKVIFFLIVNCYLLNLVMVADLTDRDWRVTTRVRRRSSYYLPATHPNTFSIKTDLKEM